MTPRNRRRVIVTSILVSVLALAGAWVAAQISLTTFSPGDTIRAADVNANFAALGEAINELQGSFGGSSPAVSGRGANCVMGAVWLTAGAVGGAVRADGQILDIASNTALFSLLGTTYGGDGRTTFALPDLQHAAPRSADGGGLTYVICTEGTYPSRL